jgi:hypothetical protein
MIQGMLLAMGTITVEIFLLCPSDIGTNVGIVLMNDTKDSGLLRASGQRLDQGAKMVKVARGQPKSP